MKESKSLVFFGTEDFSLPSLRALVEHGFDVRLVVTKPDAPRGRSKRLVSPVVKSYAEEHGIPVVQPLKLADIEALVKQIHPAVGVLVSYGKILPERTLELFSPVGIVNVHPSLLPAYRGPAPIEAAIKNGDSETGISIMRLTAGMDEGPIFAQTTIALDGTETRPTLTASLAQAGAAYLIETLPRILSGELKPIPQQNDDVSYTSLISKQDGILRPETDTAYVLERQIRAHLGFPKSRLLVRNNDVIVTAAKVVPSIDAAPLVIPCADDTFLAVTELIAPSGKAMSAEAFLRGYAA